MKNKNKIKKGYINQAIKSESPDKLINDENTISYTGNAYKKYGKNFKFINYSTNIWHSFIIYSDSPKYLQNFHPHNPNPYEKILKYLNYLIHFFLLIFSIIRIKKRKYQDVF